MVVCLQPVWLSDHSRLTSFLLCCLALRSQHLHCWVKRSAWMQTYDLTYSCTLFWCGFRCSQKCIFHWLPMRCGNVLISLCCWHSYTQMNGIYNESKLSLKYIPEDWNFLNLIKTNVSLLFARGTESRLFAVICLWYKHLVMMMQFSQNELLLSYMWLTEEP